MTTIKNPADFDLYGAIGTVTELVPTTGRNSPVAPATYSVDKGKEKPTFEDKIAMSYGVPIPMRDSSGEFDEIIRDADGKPKTGMAVMINGEAAEAHRLSEALFDVDGIDWGGIFVNPPDREYIAALIGKVNGFTGPDIETQVEVAIAKIADATASSWTASHRHVDAVIRYAIDPETGKQLWSGGSSLKRDIILADALCDSTWLIRNAFNSALFGFWNSNSGTGVRAKLARGISASVTGFGSHLVATGTTKGSVIGDVYNDLLIGFDKHGQLQLLDKKPSKGDYRPSVQGLGTVPGPVGASAISCETILRRSSLSLAGMRRIRFADDPDSAKRTAAVRALAAAGMYATSVVATEVSFLRSGTTLRPQSTVWPAHTTAGEKSLLEVDSDSARDVLLAAMDDLDRLGLGQAEPIQLRHSDAVLELMIKSLAAKKSEGESDS
ncbi:hypothetical protein H7J07_05660 [Mycobacterium koreense]|uniref:Uncharacterized protein n=1 Tax=Mycolicibacillus koreensis TaxID=1069220 RepID=A0A7I7SDA7_9MYCO|nr:type I-U CRISPR-associated protein Cas7 [Mycolicibacillus koreensis]MCV7247711.1 hypothetical protein [Mycolicibacillus koreensis]OSC34756.1 hypothetical protein B8W67_05780 [Mycolicibacillus koreensis]BBY54096.1 hypothetical protein MKOR_13470 [Mycolicibacillus koreensis]